MADSNKNVKSCFSANFRAIEEEWVHSNKRRVNLSLQIRAIYMQGLAFLVHTFHKVRLCKKNHVA